MSRESKRLRSLKFALVALLASAALLASPRLAERVYAQEGGSTCSADCSKGSCTASGDSCDCTCSFWTGVPICSCQSEEEEVTP